MPSVDETLRHAFGASDDEWVRRAEPARLVVMARHRRNLALRRGAAALVAAAVVAGVVAMTTGEPDGRSVEPASPTVPAPSLPATATPLEGTWTSAPLDNADVRAAARAAGVPEVAQRMLDQLPGAPFRVVAVVRGATLTTTLVSAGVEDEVMDMESLSVTGRRVQVRPYAMDARTIHAWSLVGDELTLSFVSTTEPVTDGVPGEAWHRLLYDTVAFTR